MPLPTRLPPTFWEGDLSAVIKGKTAACGASAPSRCPAAPHPPPHPAHSPHLIRCRCDPSSCPVPIAPDLPRPCQQDNIQVYHFGCGVATHADLASLQSQIDTLRGNSNNGTPAPGSLGAINDTLNNMAQSAHFIEWKVSALGATDSAIIDAMSTLNSRVDSLGTAAPTKSEVASSINAAVAPLQAKDGSLQSAVDALTSQVAGLQSGGGGGASTAQVTALLTKLDTVNSTVMGLQGSVASQGVQLGTLQGSVTSLQGSVATLLGSAATLQAADASQAAAITALQAANTTTNGRIDTLEGSITTLQGSITTLQGSSTTLQGSLAALQATDASQGAAISELQAANATTRGRIDTLQAQLDGITNIQVGASQCGPRGVGAVWQRTQGTLIYLGLQNSRHSALARPSRPRMHAEQLAAHAYARTDMATVCLHPTGPAPSPTAAQGPSFAEFDAARDNGDGLLGIISITLGGTGFSAASVDVLRLPTEGQPNLSLMTLRLQLSDVLAMALSGTASITLTGNFVNRNSATSSPPALEGFTVQNAPAGGFQCPRINAEILGIGGIHVGFSTVVPTIKTTGGTNTLELHNPSALNIATIQSGTAITCSFFATYAGSLA
jgi:hypothetical protein